VLVFVLINAVEHVDGAEIERTHFDLGNGERDAALIECVFRRTAGRAFENDRARGANLADVADEQIRIDTLEQVLVARMKVSDGSAGGFATNHLRGNIERPGKFFLLFLPGDRRDTNHDVVRHIGTERREPYFSSRWRPSRNPRKTRTKLHCSTSTGVEYHPIFLLVPTRQAGDAT